MVWTRTVGGAGDDQGMSVDQSGDGGYVIAGMTASSGAGACDVYLIKIDAVGETVWTRTVGGVGDDRGMSVRRTTDGGYIVAGTTSSAGAGGNDVYIVKTDGDGDTVWTRSVGGAGDDQGESVRQTVDGGYIVSGKTASFSGSGFYDVYLVKTDVGGDTVWTRSFGGTTNDYGHSVVQVRDGGYVVAGHTSVGIKPFNILLMKANAEGATLWTRSITGFYGDGDLSEEDGFSIQQTSDGGYVIAGVTDFFGPGGKDVYLVKTDENGRIE